MYQESIRDSVFFSSNVQKYKNPPNAFDHLKLNMDPLRHMIFKYLLDRFFYKSCLNKKVVLSYLNTYRIQTSGYTDRKKRF